MGLVMASRLFFNLALIWTAVFLWAGSGRALADSVTIDEPIDGQKVSGTYSPVKFKVILTPQFGAPTTFGVVDGICYYVCLGAAGDLGFHWDTTHLPDDGTSDVDCFVRRIDPMTGKVVSETHDHAYPLRYNKGYVFNRHDFETQSPEADSIVGSLEAMNHSVSQDTSGWAYADVAVAIKTATALHIGSHGSVWNGKTWFLDDTVDPIPPDACSRCTFSSNPCVCGLWISSDDVGTLVGSRANDHIPPFNFVFMSCCHSIDQYDMAQKFGIPNYASTNPDTWDHAYLGWAGTVPIVGGTTYDKTLWDSLAQQKQLQDAMFDAEWASGLTNDWAYGDYKTKLHGLYQP